MAINDTRASADPTPAEASAPPAPAAAKQRAGFNQLFVCRACARCFLDRAATEPVEVSGECYEQLVRVPHPKYPDDDELAKTDRVRIEPDAPLALGEVFFTVPARAAAECCPTHTALVDARTLQFHRTLAGVLEVCGAVHLE